MCQLMSCTVMCAHFYWPYTSLDAYSKSQCMTLVKKNFHTHKNFHTQPYVTSTGTFYLCII